jgi:hypothetical protein
MDKKLKKKGPGMLLRAGKLEKLPPMPMLAADLSKHQTTRGQGFYLALWLTVKAVDAGISDAAVDQRAFPSIWSPRA